MSTHFHPLRVVDVSPETDEAIALTLEAVASDLPLFGFKPGQHLTLRAEIGGEDVRRNYSLFVSPDEGKLRVAIKRIAGGVFSDWASRSLKAGDIIESMTPRGHFTWKFEPEQRRQYVAFAAGSGITPVLSLIKTGLAVEPESQFTLLYGNRTSTSIMFLEDIAALKDRYLSRLQVYHFLDAESDDIELFNGRLDRERVAAVLETLVDPAQVDAAFICGPGPMMDTAEAALKEAGVDPDAIMVERFSVGRPEAAQAAIAEAATREAAGLLIQVGIDGRRRMVTFDAAEGNILDSARAAGLPAPFACKAGVCATCRAKLVSGEVRMLANYGLSKEEVAAGYILTCQAVPLGEGVAVEYDA
jgi:ring-1,2-phenylacetyl-CoA epoxidase subunit PaaE